MGEITITISKDGGNVKIDANGFTGESCSNFAEPLIKALGDAKQGEKKPEFYQQSIGGVTVGH